MAQKSGNLPALTFLEAPLYLGNYPGIDLSRIEIHLLVIQSFVRQQGLVPFLQSFLQKYVAQVFRLIIRFLHHYAKILHHSVYQQ